MTFGGATFSEEHDGSRLRAQLDRVRAFMLCSPAWFRLQTIASCLGYPEASISARLRDLRKAKFGGYRVERRRVPGGHGLHEYRVLPPKPQATLF